MDIYNQIKKKNISELIDIIEFLLNAGVPQNSLIPLVNHLRELAVGDKPSPEKTLFDIIKGKDGINENLRERLVKVIKDYFVDERVK